ncbi:MAG: hypothetical protein ACI8WB_005757 [Phenylobacterium sp.]|jgi:hypothetical protein
MKITAFNTIMQLALIVPLIHCSTGLCAPNTPATKSENCTQFKIEQDDDELLTVQEKIERMDEALFDSIDRYETCMPKVSAVSGGGGSGGGGAGSGGGGTGSGSGSQGSAASESEGEASSETETENADTREIENESLQGGSVPKDIPAADNDSVVQRQIRAAALKETDPVKRQKLWDLHRKYGKK